MAVESLLRELLEAGSLTQVLIQSERLSEAARLEPEDVEALAAAIAGEDQIVAIAALHAVSHIENDATGAGSTADAVLAGALRDPRPFIREHAAWAAGRRRPDAASIDPLIALLVGGGMGGMLAQRTLEAWGDDAGELLIEGLELALEQHADASVRRRVTETLGLIVDPRATAALNRIEGDGREAGEVREAAREALDDAQRRDSPHAAATSGASKAPQELTVAQLFLGADIDAGLRTVGSGNNGGIATLLVRLGDALVNGGRRDDHAASEPAAPVGRVLTLSRGGDTLSAPVARDDHTRHEYAQIRLPITATRAEDTWSNFVAARRGIARALADHGPVHAIHLRMADVGTLAAWDVARSAGIPVIFTAAPDPHALIESLEHTGALTRQNFGDHDARDRYWLRARLVHDLARAADHTVLMPRENLRDDLHRLVGIEVGDPAQYTAVAEGIDVAVIDEAVTDARGLASGATAGPELHELRELLRQLPPHRRDLPLLISVGRLHRVKGMSAIVEAWSDSALHARCNLLIVGGNLSRPSADEAEQLAHIDATVDPTERAAHGLLLVGHRPNETAARWIAAARFGIPGLAAPHGVYVCGSMKEEFGLAILEAMAAGLFVIAPLRGGPATYVEQGRTGLLVDTSNSERLREAIVEGLAAAPRAANDRAIASRALVSERFSIHTMANTLAGIYAAAHQRRDSASHTDSDSHA